MGVDWFGCTKCSDTFPDCGPYEHCDECCTVWCSEECAEADGAVYGDDGCIESCKYCRKEDLPDYQLVEFMLKYFNWTREDIVKQYFKDNK